MIAATRGPASLLADYQATRTPINILKAEFDNLRTSQPQIRHKPKNGEIPLSRRAMTIHALQQVTILFCGKNI
jgi:hypothetical protein